MALAAKITVTKLFTYRGNPEYWSNSYHLDATPPDAAHWETLAGDLAGLELPCYSAQCQVYSFLGYDDSSPGHAAIWSALAADIGADAFGTQAAGSNAPWAGDQAGTIGWKTGDVGSSGKPIWLRKYFHSGFSAPGPPDDNLSTTCATNYAAFAASCLDDPLSATAGPSDGPVHMANKNGDRPAGPIRVDPWVTTRTLRRRGRRPS